MDQATKDYHAFKLDKEERLILYAHLSQQQAIQVLELNGKLAESMDKSKLLIEKTLGDKISAIKSSCGEQEFSYSMMYVGDKGLPIRGPCTPEDPLIPRHSRNDYLGIRSS
jgi:hypothetical protein